MRQGRDVADLCLRYGKGLPGPAERDMNGFDGMTSASFVAVVVFVVDVVIVVAQGFMDDKSCSRSVGTAGRGSVAAHKQRSREGR